jgi:cytochrome oxidase Cu insertion factor (SCO1/SenC/PrrC family)
MIRTPIAVVPYALMIAATGAGLLWHAGEMTARLGGSVTTGTAEIGGPFTLTDQDGKTRSAADFRGRYMLVYFGYSFCPDVCPTTLAMEAAALSKLGAKAARIAPVFITIDPARDKPSVLKNYLASFGKDFVGLTGDEKSIANVEREYHVYSVKRALAGGTYAMDHSSILYLIGPDGGFVTYYEDQIGPDGLAADLRKRL